MRTVARPSIPVNRSAENAALHAANVRLASLRAVRVQAGKTTTNDAAGSAANTASRSQSADVDLHRRRQQHPSRPQPAAPRRPKASSPLTAWQSLPMRQPDMLSVELNSAESLDADNANTDAAPIDLTTTTLRMYPDVLLGMLRQEQVAVGRVWLLARYLDTSGRGWIAVADLRKQLTGKASPLRICGKRRLRQILASGAETFWQRDDFGRLWLFGTARVAQALEVSYLSHRAIALPVAGLVAGLAEARAHCYAAFHSGRKTDHDDGFANPVGRETLAGIAGVCGRTQQKYDALTGTEARMCIGLGAAQTTSENSEPAQETAWEHGRGTFSFTDRRGQHGAAGTTYLAWRLPNQYRGCHTKLKTGNRRKLNRRLRHSVNHSAADDLVKIRARGNGQMQGHDDGAGNERVERVFCTDSYATMAVCGKAQRTQLYQLEPSVNSCGVWRRMVR